MEITTFSWFWKSYYCKKKGLSPYNSNTWKEAGEEFSKHFRLVTGRDTLCDETDKSGEEVFVGNIEFGKEIPKFLEGLNTIRIGNKPLDINGIPIDPNHCRPMYVGRIEFERFNKLCEDEFQRIKYKE